MANAALTPTEKQVHDALCGNAEGEAWQGWRDVYLDNATPTGMSPRSFAGYLSSLERKGLYKPIDNFAWGSVLCESRP